MSQLDGKIALVTGASRGIGKRLPRSLLSKVLRLSEPQPVKMVRKRSAIIFLSSAAKALH